MKTKKFDCVEMKRLGAETVQEKLQGKSVDEQVKYWKTRTDALRERQIRIKNNTRLPN